MRFHSYLQTSDEAIYSVTEVNGLDHRIVDASVGLNHVALVSETGQMIVMGDNRHGQKGLNHVNVTRQNSPIHSIRPISVIVNIH